MLVHEHFFNRVPKLMRMLELREKEDIQIQISKFLLIKNDDDGKKRNKDIYISPNLQRYFDNAPKTLHEWDRKYPHKEETKSFSTQPYSPPLLTKVSLRSSSYSSYNPLILSLSSLFHAFFISFSFHVFNYDTMTF